MKARINTFTPMDFISAEAVGTDVPRRCATCRHCKECEFKLQCLTWEENKQLETVEKGLKLDVEAKKWTASYPFTTPPTVLEDNYGQAVACMRSMEKRLAKQGNLEHFNKNFQETIDRGVFKELTKEEADSYTGPVNYITMTETFKPGSTSPIRICMNSSMKQPGTRLSLNDILMKGPSSLADLFAITVGFREFKYAAAKDLSKFYQCVAADITAQHLRLSLIHISEPTRRS